jgi:prephenate dehydrogenase
MRIRTLTIVGVGLIGGSVGLAAKRRGLAEHVIGVGRQELSLERAKARGAIDEACLDLTTAAHKADVAVFCTPVDLIAEQVLAAAPSSRPGTLFTDAGSTKAAILEKVEGRMPEGVAFVGSHPLAGSEKKGPEHADANLFEGRLTIVTKTARTDTEALARTADFWRSLGSRVRVMNPVEHDESLAFTSHMPHLVSAALASVLPAELQDLTASGFRDTTRIAAGDPAIWSAIFAQNREAILAAVDRLDNHISSFRRALENGDWPGVLELLTRAKEARDALGN